jgi:hypothetical protein
MIGGLYLAQYWFLLTAPTPSTGGLALSKTVLPGPKVRPIVMKNKGA